MSTNEGGKGCKPRPFSVTQEEYDNRWDAIFGRNKREDVDAEEAEPKDLEEDKK